MPTEDAQARRERLARAVDDLFVNGSGEQAARLVLVDAHGCNLGGWGKGPLLDRLEAALSLPPAPAQPGVDLEAIKALEPRWRTLADSSETRGGTATRECADELKSAIAEVERLAAGNRSNQ